MNIKIDNCKSIKKADISITESKINIKYGMNGTGKSTISQAISTFINNQDKELLVPFRLKNKINQTAEKVNISGHENIKSILVFNEEYINNFLFKKEELLSNSFEVFIKTRDYDKRMEEIEKLYIDAQKTFRNNDDIKNIINDFTNFITSFGKAASGYSKSGNVHKALKDGNKLHNVPEGLDDYGEYIQSDKKLEWINWQLSGNNYSHISKNCPFCTSEFESKKQTIEKFKEEYGNYNTQKLLDLIKLIVSIEKYLSLNVKDEINKLLKSKNMLNSEEINYLVGVKQEVEILNEKLIKLTEISFYSLRGIDKVDEFIKFLDDIRINSNCIDKLQSDDTKTLLNMIEEAINNLREKAGKLQDEINQQNSLIKRNIQKYEKEINEFLFKSGYKYTIGFKYENEKYKWGCPRYLKQLLFC